MDKGRKGDEEEGKTTRSCEEDTVQAVISKK